MPLYEVIHVAPLSPGQKDALAEAITDLHANSNINDAWRRVVHPDLPTSTMMPRELELAAIYITGELLAGMKFGFPIPAAGCEMAWSEIHYPSFKARAALGDETFVEFVADLEKKPGFNRRADD
ncbi:hypothetical protein APSETT444_004813 [Aspergillus pseudonomiae]